MSAQALELALSGVGMVTSVGHDAITACAAIRAGISRPSPIDEQPVTNLADHESAVLIGHPVVPITNGFGGIGRWLQLARSALLDLLGRLELRERGWGKTALCISLPELTAPRFEHNRELRAERIHAALVAPLLAQTGLEIDPHAVELRARGRAGLPDLLAEIDGALRAVAERVVVIAVDSYVESSTLTWLDETQRLKHDDNPVGLSPGEAAVAVCFERAGRADPARSWARITAAGVVSGSSDAIACSQAAGRLFAELLVPGVGELHTDLNGEAPRAHAYGLLLSALPPRLGEGLSLYHAAAEVGDTGEVSAMCNLCLAARSLQRGYAKGEATVVAGLCGDGGMVGVRLERSA